MHRLGWLIWPGIFVILLFCTLPAQAQKDILFQMVDPGGDDFGDGKLLYPEHEIFVPGLFDLRKFTVELDADHIYFDFQFATITNPFDAPEGFFHQRLEVFIDTGMPGGKNEIRVGNYLLKTSPGESWKIHLSIAPFGETFVEVLNYEGEKKSFSEGIKSYVLADDQTIRVQVARSLLPEPNRSWRYYVLVGSFDGLAVSFWRELGIGSWQLGGEGLPVFDILAPRWGKKSQKKQLLERVLFSVGVEKAIPKLFAVLGLAVVSLLGYMLWRWYGGRT